MLCIFALSRHVYLHFSAKLFNYDLWIFYELLRLETGGSEIIAYEIIMHRSRFVFHLDEWVFCKTSTHGSDFNRKRSYSAGVIYYCRSIIVFLNQHLIKHGCTAGCRTRISFWIYHSVILCGHWKLSHLVFGCLTSLKFMDRVFGRSLITSVSQWILFGIEMNTNNNKSKPKIILVGWRFRFGSSLFIEKWRRNYFIFNEMI